MPKGVYIRTAKCNKINSESKKGCTPWNKDKKGVQVAWNKNKKGGTSWNKGLTAKTDKRVAKQGYSRRILIETRVCECGCGGTFICKVTSDQRFLSHHHTKDIKWSQETIDKRAKSNTIPRETRTCLCGCNKTFICKVTSDKQYIHGHNLKNITQEVKSDNSKKLWEDPEYRNNQLKAMAAGITKEPNGPEKLLFNMVDKLSPGSWLLNIKGEYLTLENKKPDIVNLKDKKIIEHQGDYWHANKEFCKLNGITEINGGVSVESIRQKDKLKLDIYKKNNWDCLIIWEHELSNIEELQNRIANFVTGVSHT